MAISAGLHFGWPSPAIPKLLNQELEFQVTEDDASYIVMIGPLGYILSSPFSMVIIDKIGRKTSILLTAMPQIIAWLLIVNSTSITSLYIARIVAVAAEGALFTVQPLYICEISKPKIRGFLGTIFTLSLALGVLLINCYGSYTSLQDSARISMGVSVLSIIIGMSMPESPYFYLIKGSIDDARTSLKFLRQIENVEEELECLKKDVKRQISEKGTFKEIFTVSENIKAFIILIVLRTLQQFTGYSAHNFYFQIIFVNVKGGLGASENSIIYNASHLVFIGLDLFLIDRFGRWPLLLWSLIGITLVLLLEGVYFLLLNLEYNLPSFMWVPITGMILYAIMLDMGLGVVPNVLTGEIFSASIKTKALGIIIIYGAITISASSKLFQWLKMLYGIHVSFFVFSCCGFIGALFCHFYVPETKGKSLEEIQQILKNK